MVWCLKAVVCQCSQYLVDGRCGTRSLSISHHHPSRHATNMSALFNFQSLLLVIILMICTCTYVRAVAPGIVDRNKQGFLGLFWMSARIGERLSPYVAMACIAMAVTILIQ